MLQRMNGFEVGGTTRACTKGIWIWSSPIDLEIKVGGDLVPVDMYFLDCEGTSSLERDASVDALLITMSIFLSSILIYNTMGAIEEKKIEELSALTMLIDRISKKNSELGFDILKDFPQLFWILRDFTLDLETNTPQDYLEKCLAEVPPDTVQTEADLVEIKNKNNMRKTIKQFFKNRTCLTFGRPVSEETILQNVDNDSLIREEFKSDVDNLMKMLTLYISPKTVNKNYLNGRVFFGFLENLVEVLNTGEVPMLNTAVDRLLDAEATEKTKTIINSGIQGMEKIKEKLPVTDLALNHMYNDLILDHLEMLREQVSYMTSKENYSSNLKLFMKTMKDKLVETETENKAIKSQNATNLLNSFSTAMLPLKTAAPSTFASASEGVDPINSLKTLVTGYFPKITQEEMDISALLSPILDQILAYSSQVVGGFQDILKHTQEEKERDIKEFKDKEKRLKEFSGENDSYAKELEREIELLKEKIQGERSMIEKAVESKDVEINILKDKLERATEKLDKEKEGHQVYKKRITLLEEQLINTGDQMTEKDAELQNLMTKIMDSDKVLSSTAQRMNQEGAEVNSENSSAMFDLVKELARNVELLYAEIHSKNQMKVNSLAKRLTEQEKFVAELQRQRNLAQTQAREDYKKRLRDINTANKKVIESLQTARDEQVDQWRTVYAERQEKKQADIDLKRFKAQIVNLEERIKSLCSENDNLVKNQKMVSESYIEAIQYREHLQKEKVTSLDSLIEVINLVVTKPKEKVTTTALQSLQKKVSKEYIKKLKPFFEKFNVKA